MHFPVCFSWGKKNPAVRWPLKFLSSHLHIFHCPFRPPFPHGIRFQIGFHFFLDLLTIFDIFRAIFWGPKNGWHRRQEKLLAAESLYAEAPNWYPGISWCICRGNEGLWRWFFIGGQDGSSIDHPIWPKPISSYIYISIYILRYIWSKVRSFFYDMLNPSFPIVQSGCLFPRWRCSGSSSPRLMRKPRRRRRKPRFVAEFIGFHRI